MKQIFNKDVFASPPKWQNKAVPLVWVGFQKSLSKGVLKNGENPQDILIQTIYLLNPLFQGVEKNA